MNRESLAETDIIETKGFSRICHGQGHEKKGGSKITRKFPKLLKAHIEKMSAFRLSMIFMKTNELDHPFQDVDEKKGVNQKAVTNAQTERGEHRTHHVMPGRFHRRGGGGKLVGEWVLKKRC